MQAAGDYVAVAGVLVTNRRVDHKDSAMQVPDSEHNILNKARIVRENRNNQRTQASAGDRNEILQTVIRHKRRCGTKYFDVMHKLRIQSALACQKRRLHKRGLLNISVNRLELLVAAKHDFALLFQPPQPFEASGLLRLVHHWPHFHFRIPRISHLR